MTDYAALKETLIRKRGSKCEYCGRPFLVALLQMHHCLFHRRKGHPELDVEQNMMLTCPECHQSGVVNSYKCREWFWDRQVERGYNMVAWVESLPTKCKHEYQGRVNGHNVQ